MSRILPLDREVSGQISSSKSIANLHDVILALLQNSLDGKANKAEITVNFHRGACMVEDNGTGILPTEFREDGGLGKLHHTSKQGPQSHEDLYGSTGTFLASLATLSLLSVTSRHRDHSEHTKLTLHDGKVVLRLVPAPSSDELSISQSHGTRVVVRDLFGNMPVRVKQRALSVDSGSDYNKAWQELKRCIVALMLAWPKPFTVKVKDSEISGRGVSLSSYHPSVSMALTEKSLKQLHGQNYKSDVKDTLLLLFQSGLAASETRHRWVPVSAKTSKVSIKGMICLQPGPTKQCQFISLGICPCLRENGHNELYEAVNNIFATSSFGVIEDELHQDLQGQEVDRRSRSGQYTQSLKGRKGVDRWPMFILRLRSQIDIRRDSSKSEADLHTIVDVLEATVRQWLAANHFRPQKQRTRRNEAQSSPSAALSHVQIVRPSTGRSVHSALTVTGTSKSTATMDIRFKLKKRRISRSTGTLQPQENIPEWTTLNEDVPWSSRIKSGKEAWYDELQHIRRPETAPELLGNTIPSPLSVPTRSTTEMTPIEAGAFDTTETGNCTSCRVSAALDYDTTVPDTSLHHSEDFGSIDEVRMLDTADAIEKQQRPMHDHVYLPSRSAADDNTHDSIVEWTDHVTKQTFRINARTGVVLPAISRTEPPDDSPGDTEQNHARQPAAIDTSISSNGMPLSLSRRAKSNTSRLVEPIWLPRFLKDWDNPVFNRQAEQHIPVISLLEPTRGATASVNGRLTEQEMVERFRQVDSNGTSKLSKAALQRATVISQVDAKFVLCKIPLDDTSDAKDALVLVDQHAASERVILERLLQELCSPSDEQAAALTSNLGFRSVVKTVALSQPLRFDISFEDQGLFARHVDHFGRWGIIYDLSESLNVPTASQVRPPVTEYRLTVRALPPGIAERCTLFPKLLIDLLRSGVWALVDSSAHPESREVPKEPLEGEAHGWLRTIGSCPKGILDMLNSRACRSAIMFNDVLTMAECEQLLVDLSICAFPFMCAHGRVSMVPLVELQRDDDQEMGASFANMASSRTSGEDSEGFASAFSRWRSDCSSSSPLAPIPMSTYFAQMMRAMVPPANPPTTKELRVSASLLYGIFVSEKSYCIGFRNLVKAQHVKMLAAKVAGHRLSQELVDLIADALLLLEKQDVRSKWIRSDQTSDDILFKFLAEDSTPASTAAHEIITSTGVLTMTIDSDRPLSTTLPRPGPGDRRLGYYVHLSTGPSRLSLGIQLPAGSYSQIAPGSSTSAQALHYPWKKGTMRALLRQNRPPGIPATDWLCYQPDSASRKRGDPEGQVDSRNCISRLIHCGSVEEVIREWDVEAVKKLVDLMELHVVPFDEGDPFKPGLHIWQMTEEAGG